MTTLEKILAQENSNCKQKIQELVSIWMKDNDVKCWDDLRYPWEYNIADPDYNFHVESGATKVVLIPNDATYVIKIPFCGEDEYYFNGGGEALDTSYDYCGAEAEYYEEAVWYGCDQFLVPTAYFGEINDVPIYIQTKIYSMYNAVKPSDDSIYKYASIKNSEMLNAVTGAKLLEYYSAEEVAAFTEFLHENGIDDLDSYRNGGYVSSYGRYVFWDYCGYRE